ncbi:hypothetical protein JRI60_48870 [Archangium violaceum]|uniref:hypothetical protein n=1 Tax=Archangium violaceum TaxID=83451 RepID=UPI00194DEFCA|nr:hypothetical protein [Archangium violaceum]QRN96812.1 hypothetical protein JRI60_48870 [Archangium violaceum]
MMKMRELLTGALAGIALTLAGCAPEEAKTPSGDGLMSVAVRGLSAGQITQMILTAQPANVSKSLILDPNTGVFGGLLVLPSGTHTLTATGYGVDPTVVVASGTGTVTVTPNTTTPVALRIYDQTAMQGQQDIAPMLRSMSASKADLVVNEPITVSVDAVDLDGDALAYAWTSDCPSGSFADPSAAITTWKSSAPASCTLQVSVTSRDITLHETVPVLVYSAPGGGGEGGVQVAGEYVPRPHVDSLYMRGPGVYQSVSRGDYLANFVPASAGQQYTLELSVGFDTYFGTFDAGVQTDCGTLVKQYDSCGSGGYCYVTYLWTAPAAGSACKLTATAANGSLVDRFSAGIFVK